MLRSAWLLLALTACGCGPLGPIPGGGLRGEVVTESVDSWSFTFDHDTVQLETRPADPYSVNVWIIGHEGNLYVPTSLIAGTDEPSDRQWVQNVLADPDVRVRIDGRLYERRAGRVEDPAELEAVRAKLLAKYEVEKSDDGREVRAWIFRLEPR